MTFLLVLLAIAVVVLALGLIRMRRRSRPLERLIEEMEKVDLSRSGPLLAGLPSWSIPLLHLES